MYIIETLELVLLMSTSFFSFQRNTFQAVLVTNGINSFAIFNYDKLTWTTGTASSGNSSGHGGKPAQVLFTSRGSHSKYF